MYVCMYNMYMRVCLYLYIEADMVIYEGEAGSNGPNALPPPPPPPPRKEGGYPAGCRCCRAGRTCSAKS